MALIWRVQGTTAMENHPSWDGYGPVRPDEPSQEWPGYWWAELVGAAPGVSPWCLIREEDVERAAEEDVDYYVPGLMGCDEPEELAMYIEQNVGGPEGLVVALYDGEIVERRVGDGVVFRPVRLLGVWPAEEWLEQSWDDEE